MERIRSLCLFDFLLICYLFISMYFTSYYCFITFLLNLFKTCLPCVLAMFISFYVCLNCRGRVVIKVVRT